MSQRGMTSSQYDFIQSAISVNTFGWGDYRDAGYCFTLPNLIDSFDLFDRQEQLVSYFIFFFFLKLRALKEEQRHQSNVKWRYYACVTPFDARTKRETGRDLFFFQNTCLSLSKASRYFSNATRMHVNIQHRGAIIGKKKGCCTLTNRASEAISL